MTETAVRALMALLLAGVTLSGAALPALAEATEVAAAAIARRFGTQAVEGKIQASVVVVDA